MKTAKNNAQRLQSLLSNLTEGDLAGLDAEIAASKARTRSLEATRDLVAEEVLNRVPAPKKPPAVATAPAPANGASSVPAGRPSLEEYTRRVGVFLASNGPTRKSLILAATHVLGTQLDKVLKSDDGELWFEEQPRGVYLTARGQQEFSPKKDD